MSLALHSTGTLGLTSGRSAPRRQRKRRSPPAIPARPGRRRCCRSRPQRDTGAAGAAARRGQRDPARRARSRPRPPGWPGRTAARRCIRSGSLRDRSLPMRLAAEGEAVTMSAHLLDVVIALRVPAAEAWRRLTGLPRGTWGMTLAHLGLGVFVLGACVETGWRWLTRLGFSLQVPRPRNPKAATAAEQQEWKRRPGRPDGRAAPRAARPGRRAVGRG